MENDFLTDFVQQISKEEEARNAEKKRKQFFREIGRKGGLRKKTSTHFLRKFTVRFTEREFEEIQKLSKKHSLKISEYIRLVLTEKELKINLSQMRLIIFHFNSEPNIVFILQMK